MRLMLLAIALGLAGCLNCNDAPIRGFTIDGGLPDGWPVDRAPTLDECRHFCGDSYQGTPLQFCAGDQTVDCTFQAACLKLD
jgi:hypothetical protein